MIFATLLCWGALALVVFFVDPEETTWVGIAIFYLALFFSVLGTAAIIGFGIRHLLRPRQFAFIQVKNSFRQAVWFAILVVVTLLLQSKGLISWWNLAVLIVFLGLVEMFWASLHTSK